MRGEFTLLKIHLIIIAKKIYYFLKALNEEPKKPETRISDDLPEYQKHFVDW